MIKYTKSIYAYIEVMTMEKSVKGVKNLASATEVPRNCDDEPLFPFKGRYQSCNKTSEMH